MGDRQAHPGQSANQNDPDQRDSPEVPEGEADRTDPSRQRYDQPPADEDLERARGERAQSDGP